jgi:hypothetical protein
MRDTAIFYNVFMVICLVQSLPKKQFPSRPPQISTRNPPSHPSRGADRESSRTRGGMRWTQQRRREACSQGGFAVSEQQRADERRFRFAKASTDLHLSAAKPLDEDGCCVRQNRVVLAPVAGVKLSVANLIQPD